MPIAAIRLILTVAGACLWITSAQGQTCTTTSTGIAFGSYNTTQAAATDGAGSVSIRCTALLSLSLSYTVDLSAGASGTYATRRMTRGPSILNYNLYTTAARTTIWGNGTGGTGRISVNGIIITILTPHAATYPVYGRIPARQNVPVGGYLDNIVATVTY